jgi:hypothetical protein
MNLSELFKQAERIQKINDFCRNYKGDDKEVIEWCKERQRKFLLSMREEITNGESFFDTNGNRKRIR